MSNCCDAEHQELLATLKTPLPKTKGQRAVALCPSSTTVGRCLVPKLIRDVAFFVHFAERALRLDAVAAAETAKTTAALTQDAGRHHPWLDEDFRIFNRHLVFEFVPDTSEFLDRMHAAGVEEAASSKPRRVDEVDRVDDERISLPGADAVAVVHREVRLPRVPLAAINRDVAEFFVAAAVIGIRAVEED